MQRFINAKTQKNIELLCVLSNKKQYIEKHQVTHRRNVLTYLQIRTEIFKGKTHSRISSNILPPSKNLIGRRLNKPKDKLKVAGDCK